MKKNLIIMLIFCVSILLTGCSETITKDESGNVKKEFSINETAIVNNTKVKINSIKKITSECSWEYDGKCYSFSEPENDYFLLIDLTLENLSDEEENISSIFQFELKKPNGEKASQEYMLKSVTSSLDGSIMGHDLLKGQVAYDVSDEEYFYFYYKDSLLDDNIKFVINKKEISE